MRIFSLCLSLWMVVTPLISSAQGIGGSRGVQALTPPSNRAGGSSFGSDFKSSTGLSESMLSSPGGQLLAEPQYSGLSYQVHILGEVTNPGTYRVNASARLSEALQLAGGIATPQGSERRIQLRRKGEETKTIDLLSFKRFANLDANPYLLDNDVVYVPLVGPVVQMMGTVKRPGTYELTGEKSVQDLVQLAGGFTPGVSTPGSFKIIRFENGEKKVLSFDDTQAEREKAQVQGADVIVIPHVLTRDKKFDYNVAKLPGDNPLFYPSFEERVFVIGGVYEPGPYPYSPYYDVRQYITLAGGTTKVAKSERRWRIITAEGKKIRAKVDTAINPGDAIIIPEKYMPPESWLSLVLGTSSAILGITTTVLTLTR